MSNSLPETTSQDLVVAPFRSGRLTGTEQLNTNFPMESAYILDFWQWAFSGLRDNAIRGIFAEWLVSKVLRLPMTARSCWDECDLVTPEGINIEVKAAAYLQSWTKGVGTSKINFSGLRGQTWSIEKGYSGSSTYNADLYIFCVQIERDPTLWNALDLNQWRFYVLTRQQVMSKGFRSLGLKSVTKLTQELTVETLATVVNPYRKTKEKENMSMSKEEDEKGSKEFAERQGYMDGMLIRKKGKVVYVHHTEPDHNPTELEQKTEDQNRNANEESSGMDK